MTMTQAQTILELKNALGNMLTLIEDRVDEELTPREQKLFDEAAELYAQVNSPAIVQTAAKKGVRRAS